MQIYLPAYLLLRFQSLLIRMEVGDLCVKFKTFHGFEIMKNLFSKFSTKYSNYIWKFGQHIISFKILLFEIYFSNIVFKEF